MAPIPMPFPSFRQPPVPPAVVAQTNPWQQFASSPLATALGNNSNALIGLGTALLSNPRFSDAAAAAGQNWMTGHALDASAAEKKKAEGEAARQKNATMDYLRKTYPDLANAVDGGMPIGQAWTEASKRQQPGYGQRVISPGSVVLGPDNQPIYTAPTNTASTAPSGYRYTSDRTGLEPIPGGPADPNTAFSLTPEALDLISSQYLAGDKGAITGYARNATMRAMIANAIAAKADAMGMDGRAIAAQVSAFGGNVAAQRAAGTRAAQVGMAASEASQMADIALEASAKVPRGNLMPWNALTNAVAQGTSSPEMAQFVTATTSLVNAYARAVSPLGAPTDAMRAHAEQMLNTAQSPEAYAAVIAQMKAEMQAALNAPAEISSNLKSSITGGGGQWTPQGAPAMSGTTASGVQWSVSP